MTDGGEHGIATESAQTGPRWEWPLVLVLLVIVVGLIVVVLVSFRRGCVIVSAGVVLAFFLRALLSPTDAGLLAVRARSTDLWVLGVLSVALTVLSFWVPPPR